MSNAVIIHFGSLFTFNLSTALLVLSKKQMQSGEPRGRKISASDRSNAILLINEAVESDASLSKACERLGITEHTFYRVLHEEKMQNHRGRNQEPYKHAKPTSYCTTTPNQVWTWDITYLNGPYKWCFYYLYLILDLFSHDVVGWEVYGAAKTAHPERWNGRKVHNWDNIDKVFLNPDKVESANDAIVQQVS